MASSRIFVKNLPPSITEEEFRKHFSVKQPITDAKLISQRRIGYVGYKTPEDAARAVKYFNKSFIRMSRLGVEIAKPIADKTLPASNRAGRGSLGHKNYSESLIDPAPRLSLKRKHGEVETVNTADPKLREFLEVMQPTKTENWPVSESEQRSANEPPHKIQAIEVPDAASDGEYDEVSEPLTRVSTMLKPMKTSPLTTAITLSEDHSGLVAQAVDGDHNRAANLSGLEATDDDWLRSRTNRLLDLMDPTSTDVGLISSDRRQLYELRATIEEPASDDYRLPEDAKTLVEDGVVREEPPQDIARQSIEAIQDSGRLFIRNLPYTTAEEDLASHFKNFGTFQEIHLPLDANGMSKGFALVQFAEPSAAVEAFHQLDGSSFQGRLLHILPAEARKDNKLDAFEMAKLPLKRQKQIKKKAEASATTFNWNSLYMSQDAVNASVADRMGVSKSDLLDPTSSEAAVKQAIAETTIIQDTKAYFASNGVDLNAFSRRERGDTAILVKNFPYGMSIEELRRMFEEFGQVIRVLMPPAGTIAIVEFAQPPQARAAFASLAYRRLKDSILFLEKAPRDLFTDVNLNNAIPPTFEEDGRHVLEPKPSVSDLLEKESHQGTLDTSTLFVRNLNFDTSSERLTEVFKPLLGFMSARVNTKTDPKKPGQVLSMGFGFLEFRTKSQAQAALLTMNGYNLDGHHLIIKASHKGLDATEERKRDERAKGKRTKIIIKNLPFEASKTDVRALFGTYGQLRSVRVPKKFDNSARGFAFADFVTSREAENALEALKHTHFLGRRLVLEFAEEDILDAEEEIAKMQEKIGKQVSKVALQKLTGGGRKKFNIEGADNDEER